jgi:hypothetical protein
MRQLIQQSIDAFAEAVLAVLVMVAAMLALKGRGILEHWFRVKPKPIEETLRSDVEITLILERTRLALGAQRVFLAKYHNGDHFDDSSEIRRKSRTHEVVADGVAYQTEEYKGVLTSSIPDETAIVLQEGPSFVRVEDLKPGKFRWLNERGGTISIARCAIRRGKNVIGFVGADFWSENEPPNMDLLCDAANDIGQILNNQSS